ncbi:MAG: efflux RND transporter periplasmic adaptor subunit [Shimia sp.]
MPKGIETMRKLLRGLWIVIRELFWVGLAVALVAGGVFGFRYLAENREVVEAAPVERPITLVETQALTLHEGPLPIRGEGFIEPFRTVAISAPVGGRIVEIDPAITNRGRFSEGDLLARIDDSVERAQLAQLEANLAGTQARIDLNETQLQRTRELRERNVVPQSQLDQLLSAQAELAATLESQRAAVNSAEIALENKTVRAPFDGAVQSKSAELGTVVMGGSPIAQVYTNDRMEVDVAVREADAALIPGLFDGAPGEATVTVDFAGQPVTWGAEIVRLEPSLDRATRTLTVTLGLRELRGEVSSLASGAPPALINAFARVVIDGIEPEQTYALPSTAVRGGNRIWINENDTLQIVDATVIHVDGETTFVQAELPLDARVILTNLATPQVGKPLRDISVEMPEVQQTAAADPAE